MKMKFKGDIVITDPCYFIKNNCDYNYNDVPKLADYCKIELWDRDDVRKPTDEELEELKQRGYGFKNSKLRGKLIAERVYSRATNSNRSIDLIMEAEKYVDENFSDLIIITSDSYEEDIKKHEKALDDFYEKHGSDKDKSNHGQDLGKLGFTKFLTSSTGYGDWSCKLIDVDTNKELGEFCADGGQVTVALLDEVLEYNPDFLYDVENRKWTNAIVKNFNGEVSIEMLEEESVYTDTQGKEIEYVSRIAKVKGIGNINFINVQIG